jgi:hypothetical protein
MQKGSAYYGYLNLIYNMTNIKEKIEENPNHKIEVRIKFFLQKKESKWEQKN